MGMELNDLLISLLAHQSPTYKEQEISRYCQDLLSKEIPDSTIEESKNSLIITLPYNADKPHISLIGHLDVVPKHVEPYQENTLIYGSGASDMKGAVACFIKLLVDYKEQYMNCPYQVSLVLYAREEGTELTENGLHDLIHRFPDYFKSLDVAIIGEPTDNEIQLGCVGSIHCMVTVEGVSAHSARPWHGENALYKAIPFIDHIANLKPQPHIIRDLTYHEVIEITESYTETGRTTIPGFWCANINYRFPPNMTLAEAQAKLQSYIMSPFPIKYEILDSAPAGDIIENDLFNTIIAELESPLTAKQAWTDVAQITGLGIPAFNYGPGLTAQAHQVNEYIDFTYMKDYDKKLRSLLFK